MAKSALVKQVEALAWAAGRIVTIGCQAHKVEWFANCDGVETYGNTPEMALKALQKALVDLEERASREAAEHALRATRLRDCIASG